MEDEIDKDKPKVQADNQSIAIGEINISGTVTGNITIGHTIVQPADARLRHELGILLKNVQTTWIQGVLEKSVHEAALLELGLEVREEAVDNPWRMVIESPDQSRQTLPRGRRIKDIFDEANRLLLILGEPGSGKTTTLLQLARDLIAEVDSAFTHAVPVILNLSTWTNKAQPLDEWLVAELTSKYRVPKKDGQRWLKERRILPLLDGLDEVKVENRAACLENINQLVTDYGLQGMVVCSRIKYYTALNVRLAFYRAIYIQPLTLEQVDEYLNKAGDKLASLRAALQADEALRSMAQSPLILNIMSLAYQNTSAGDLISPVLNTDNARRKHLFDTYIARMFKRKAIVQYYEDEQTKQRLSWLARNMQRHNQEVFLMEGLQPSWLSMRRWQWVYILASRLIASLIFGLSVGLILGQIFETLNFNLGPAPATLLSVLLNLGINSGLIFGLLLSLTDLLRFEWLHKQKEVRKPLGFRWLVINGVMIGLVVGLIFGKPIAVTAALNYGSMGGVGVFYGWLSGVLFGIGGLIFGIRISQRTLRNDIQPVEALRWFWLRALKGGLIGGLILRSLFFVYFLLIEWEYTRSHDLINLISSWISMWVIAPIGIVIGAILNRGLSREIIETKNAPNEGMRLSARNAILGGTIVGLASGLGFVPFIGVNYYELSIFLKVTLEVWLITGLLAVLWYGGLDVIQHYTLRLILVLQGHTPANYTRFLDYAVDRIFLQKVGGGYRFIHRLLLEHFAEMDETKKV